MDGFDDLLAPSRRVLEDNPFADPFAKRSNSPDPWASPFANNQPADEYGASTTPTAESYLATDTYEAGSSSSNVAEESTSVSSDPLDSAAHTADDDDGGDEESAKPRGRSTSTTHTPGFRESVAPVFSEIATIRPTEPEEHESPVPTAVEQYRASPPLHKADSLSTASSSPVSQERHYANQSSQSSSRVVSPAPSKISEFVSPLERSPAGIDHAIAGLPLGGEALGGWQAEQTGWGIQEDDDSDDDKPISQTVRISEHVDNKLVRTYYHRCRH